MPPGAEDSWREHAGGRPLAAPARPAVPSLDPLGVRVALARRPYPLPVTAQPHWADGGPGWRITIARSEVAVVGADGIVTTDDLDLLRTTGGIVLDPWVPLSGPAAEVAAIVTLAWAGVAVHAPRPPAPLRRILGGDVARLLAARAAVDPAAAPRQWVRLALLDALDREHRTAPAVVVADDQQQVDRVADKLMVPGGPVARIVCAGKGFLPLARPGVDVFEAASTYASALSSALAEVGDTGPVFVVDAAAEIPPLALADLLRARAQLGLPVVSLAERLVHLAAVDRTVARDQSTDVPVCVHGATGLLADHALLSQRVTQFAADATGEERLRDVVACLDGVPGWRLLDRGVRAEEALPIHAWGTRRAALLHHSIWERAGLVPADALGGAAA